MSNKFLKTFFHFSFVFLRNLPNIGQDFYQYLFLKNQCSLSQLKNSSVVKKMWESLIFRVLAKPVAMHALILLGFTRSFLTLRMSTW